MGSQFGRFLCRVKPVTSCRVGQWAINGISDSSFCIREMHYVSKNVIQENCQAARVNKKRSTQNAANNIILSCGHLSLWALHGSCWLTTSEIGSMNEFLCLRLFVSSWNLGQSLISSRWPYTTLQSMGVHNGIEKL